MPRRMIGNAALACCLLALTGLSAPGLGAQSLPSGDSQHDIVIDSARYDYFLHLPDPLPPGPLPLLVSLHGGGGGPQGHEETVNFRAASDAHGFVLVTPQGFAKTWNAGACCGMARSQDIDHVAALKAIVQGVAGLVPIDPGQVFAAGHSNGGMMAYRLACEAADTFAAIALSSGYLMDVDVNVDPPEPVFTCAPSRPVGILHFHGLADRCAPFFGGPGEGLDPSIRPPVHDSIAYFVTEYACARPPNVTTIGQATCLSYDGCAGGVEVELCAIAGHGHVWPGATRYPSSQICGGALNDDVGIERAWEFFERHARTE